MLGAALLELPELSLLGVLLHAIYLLGVLGPDGYVLLARINKNALCINI